jgi:hypothetical protein
MARRANDALAITKPSFGASIAERAYYRAEKRGFVPGHELEDWLAAERELAALGAARDAPSSVKSAQPEPAKKPAKKRTGRKKAAAVKKIE